MVFSQAILISTVRNMIDLHVEIKMVGWLMVQIEEGEGMIFPIQSYRIILYWEHFAFAQRSNESKLDRAMSSVDWYSNYCALQVETKNWEAMVLERSH